jgi:hypothetical protein
MSETGTILYFQLIWKEYILNWTKDKWGIIRYLEISAAKIFTKKHFRNEKSSKNWFLGPKQFLPLGAIIAFFTMDKAVITDFVKFGLNWQKYALFASSLLCHMLSEVRCIPRPFHYKSTCLKHTVFWNDAVVAAPSKVCAQI